MFLPDVTNSRSPTTFAPAVSPTSCLIEPRYSTLGDITASGSAGAAGSAAAGAAAPSRHPKVSRAARSRLMARTAFPVRRELQQGQRSTMRRRAALAPAWPRVWTSSLRRIADTWWTIVRSEVTRRWAIWPLRSPSATSSSTSRSRFVGRGDRAFAQPLGDELEHVELTFGEAGGIALRRRARPRDALRGRERAEPA